MYVKLKIQQIKIVLNLLIVINSFFIFITFSSIKHFLFSLKMLILTIKTSVYYEKHTILTFTVDWILREPIKTKNLNYKYAGVKFYYPKLAFLNKHN